MVPPKSQVSLGHRIFKFAHSWIGCLKWWKNTKSRKFSLKKILGGQGGQWKFWPNLTKIEFLHFAQLWTRVAHLICNISHISWQLWIPGVFGYKMDDWQIFYFYPVVNNSLWNMAIFREILILLLCEPPKWPQNEVTHIFRLDTLKVHVKTCKPEVSKQ